MKLQLTLTKVKASPQSSPLISSIEIEEIIIENVANFIFSENSLHLHYNDGKEEEIFLRGNDGEDQMDWRVVNISVIRKPLILLNNG